MFSRHKSLEERMNLFAIMRRHYKLMRKLSLTSAFFFSPPVSENGDHLSRWMRQEHGCGREVSPLHNFPKETGLSPTTHRVIINWTWSLRDVRGASAERLIGRCDVKNTTLFCHLLLLAELWRTAWTLFKLLSIPLPITFLDLEVLFYYWHLHCFILHASSDYP